MSWLPLSPSMPSRMWCARSAGSASGACFDARSFGRQFDPSLFNTFENLGNEDLGLSALSWLLYIAGGGIAAAIGGITWSRRNERKRRLQRDERARQGLI